MRKQSGNWNETGGVFRKLQKYDAIVGITNFCMFVCHGIEGLGAVSLQRLLSL